MGLLVLEDGRWFRGENYGAEATRLGEVVFDTALSGYQEVLTDPSFCEQIVVMTAAHVGNYGVNPEDAESDRVWAAGFAARSLCKNPSSHRSTMSLDRYLKEAGVPAIDGFDTRALVRHIRSRGAMRAAISTEIDDVETLRARIQEWPGMTGRALATEVSCRAPYVFPASPDRPAGAAVRARIHVLDGGAKRNIMKSLADLGCAVTVFPADTPADVLADGADAVMLSNGPGDPAALHGMIATVRALFGRVPVLGVCLGHQLLGLALGADTFKLRFGHRGANHPVRDLLTGRIEITSQNHGFCVDPAGIERAGGQVTHINLYDGTLEGFRHDDLRLMCVQYHPESCPGPHDAAHLFERYLQFAGRP